MPSGICLQVVSAIDETLFSSSSCLMHGIMHRTYINSAVLGVTEKKVLRTMENKIILFQKTIADECKQAQGLAALCEGQPQ